MSSVPRALLKRQYTSGSGIIPPALLMRGVRKSTSCNTVHTSGAASACLLLCRSLFACSAEAGHPKGHPHSTCDKAAHCVLSLIAGSYGIITGMVNRKVLKNPVDIISVCSPGERALCGTVRQTWLS